MDPQREAEYERSGIKKNVVRYGCTLPTLRGRAHTPSVCDDAPPPSKHQKENKDDEQRVESIDLGDRRVRPKRPRKSHQQARADRRRKHQESAEPRIILPLSPRAVGRSRFTPLRALSSSLSRGEIGSGNH